MTMIEAPQSATTDPPVSHATMPISGSPDPVLGPPRDVSGPSKRKPIKPPRDPLKTALSLVAAFGGILVGVIGFSMSYSTLAKVALSWGFSERLAAWFPVGVDASIIAFLALDLYLIIKFTPWPFLRIAAHAMTGATIWFNASSQGDIAADPVQAASHGVMPILFVIGVEAGRRLIIRKAKLEAGTADERIPLHRWILSPVATPRFYRRMRLNEVRSYDEMVRRDQELTGYKQWLTRKYDGDLKKATEDELLPMKMAKSGFTVAQALALPEQQEREAEERAEEAECRRLEAETRREIAQKQNEASRIEAEGRLEAVRARVDGETGQARAHSRAQVSAAERAAEVEQQALETALVTEARARTAEAARKEASDREAEAAADLKAADLERRAAEMRSQAAEAERVAAAEDLAIETRTIAEARRAAAEAERVAAEELRDAAEAKRAAAELEAKSEEQKRLREAAIAASALAQKDAAEAERAAAEARLVVAEIELRAVEAEDRARLRPRERKVRKVARMIIQAAGGDGGRLPLADIQRELGLASPGTASEYRTEATELVAQGYRP